MIPRDILKNIRRIEITSSRLVTDVFAGQYHSVFKGRGMEFDEVREYQMGDDVRMIDRNVTARTGRPHVKKYVEEREMTVMVLVDLSSSCHFGSVRCLKNKLAAELAAVLAFSAVRNNDKVGLILFTDRVEKFIPPRKGLRHVLRVIREVLYYRPRGISTDIAAALDFLNKVTTRRSVAFLISDFLEPGMTQDAYLKGDYRFRNALTVGNRRHDIIAVTLTDPREWDMPPCGLVVLDDAETGHSGIVDTTDPVFRRRYRDTAVRRLNSRKTFFGALGIDHIDIYTHEPYTREIVKFFKKRQRKIL